MKTEQIPALIYALSADPLAAALAAELEAEIGQLERRNFPDGEHYLRLLTDCRDRRVIICCHLNQPNSKLLEVLFLAAAAREQGATRIGLITPYLPYMRQDKAFLDGEVITSRYFAQILSQALDWLVTVDPHLHRYHSLNEIYTLQTRVVEAAPAIAHWIQQQIKQPLLIGPDSESEQWVSRVAKLAGAPYQILQKTRHGDYDVEISTLDTARFSQHTPILVDDIVSSGGTMLTTLQQLGAQGLPRATCIAVHGLFADRAYTQLSKQADVITCNTVLHPSNQIDLHPALAQATRDLL
ncbi:ribose-phosphate pyrophosphokinase [Pontibacter sp. JAM-7]|uniref:ribose-phosphate pyrophosphokinase n=1 Tax=Pontibacter sp. JAM-7 TaxID=3366581 RepID=UPI003AF77123